MEAMISIAVLQSNHGLIHGRHCWLAQQCSSIPTELSRPAIYDELFPPRKEIVAQGRIFLLTRGTDMIRGGHFSTHFSIPVRCTKRPFRCRFRAFRECPPSLRLILFKSVDFTDLFRGSCSRGHPAGDPTSNLRE